MANLILEGWMLGSDRKPAVLGIIPYQTRNIASKLTTEIFQESALLNKYFISTALIFCFYAEDFFLEAVSNW